MERQGGRMQCMVIDFGGSSAKYAVVNDRAEILFSGKTDAPLESREAFIGTVRRLYDLYGRETDGIALSLPGIIDGKTGMHHGSGAYGSILKGRNIAEEVKEACHTRVTVENDGKCGALAEVWNGALADVEDGAVLILGTGIGGGVIIDRKIHRGLHFSAGEFSFAITNFESGSLLDEAWLNIGAVGMTYKICKLKNLDLSVQDAGGVLLRYDGLLKDGYPVYGEPPAQVRADGKQIFRWLEEGDRAAERVYEEFRRSLVNLIHNIQVCFAPEKVVLGGGLSRVERLIPDMGRELEQFYGRYCIPGILHANLCRSIYLDECNLLGAMYHFMQQGNG